MGVETFSSGALLVLAIVAFLNLRDGTLGDWLAAKFLNRGEPNKRPKRDRDQQSPAPGAGGATTLANPVPGVPCSSPFGAARDGGARRHEGIDLAGAKGTPVGAAAPGRVSGVGAAGNCGLRVVIDHGAGLETRYCHLSRISVLVGRQVGTGEKIGEVGRTGNAEQSGPHLHFEVRRNGTPQDPAPLIGASCGAVQ